MYYKIDVPDELIKLAHKFDKCGSRLYIVGGYIRNKLINMSHTDIDVCGDMDIDKVCDVARSLSYKTQIINKRLGTILITSKSLMVEYTRFRKEEYDKGGSHQPQNVNFECDISDDVKRRDLTMNALYYDILNNEIIDMCDGLTDIRKKTARSVNGEKVFSSDGLRILRLIRHSCQCDFKIDKDTKKFALRNINNLCDISKSRVINELRLISKLDFVYNTKGATNNAIKLINNWHVLDKVFELQNCKIKKCNYKLINEDSVYYAMLYSIIMPYIKHGINSLEYYINNTIGNAGLKESKSCVGLIRDVAKVCAMNPSRLSAVKFMQLDMYGKDIIKLLEPKKYNSNMFYVKEISQMGLPVNKKELAITAKDILDIVCDESKISYVQELLLINVLVGNVKNEHIELVQKLNSIKDTI